MRRYFISQYPTFGSFANPTKWKIEQSPYFYWWLALTLSGDYVALCKNPSANRFKTKKKLLKVYEDFGDVLYEGDRYVAFAKWWNAKLTNGETKGAYLFAEPLTEMKVELVEDIDTAERLIADEDELLIRVSKGMKRTHIDKTLNRIFKKHIEFEKGRQTRNPNRSNARYSLSKPMAIDSLQTAFALYDLIEQAEADGTKVNNYALAKQVGIEVEQRDTEEEWNVAYKRRVMSVAVSRKKKVAVDAIKSVVKGVFPS
ncbi:hypothetical protein OA101_03005 [Alphaproteobacteria bacterium]|nr:hypothetical protein [Alphaproteobacteria bacterium]